MNLNSLGGNKGTVWASEPWMEQEINYEQQELDEWKIQLPQTPEKQRVKEWFEVTLEGDEDPQLKAQINNILNTNQEVTKEIFQEIWEVVVEQYGVGDIGADWNSFDETYHWVKTGNWDLNEWKIQRSPAFRKNQKVFLWGIETGTILDISQYGFLDDEQISSMDASIVALDKEYDNMNIPSYKDEWFYLVKTNGTDDEVNWISQAYLLARQEWNDGRQLDEWKVQPSSTISPDKLYKYGRFNRNLRTFTIQIDQNTINWMNKYYPGWDENPDIEQEGMAKFYNEVEKMAKLEYGDDITIVD